jgi:hypothetical protein
LNNLENCKMMHFQKDESIIFSYSRMRRKSNGGGYSMGPGMISPGYLENNQYTGAGKDCAGTFVRPGHMDMYSSNGLPGLSGGRRTRRRHRRRGGALAVAPFGDMVPTIPPMPVADPNAPPMPVADPNAPPMPVADPNAQGDAFIGAVPFMKGGRWGSFPEMGALNPSNGIGLSGGVPFGRVACEAGTTNMLNPNMELQMATTAVTGGRRRRVRGGSFPVVNVGAADAMRYNAPTAGYGNNFETLPAGGAVPGFTVQTPYDARGSNMACGHTGGSRRRKRTKRSRGGAHLPPADLLSPFEPITMDQVVGRQAFDGSQGYLPVKGGRRSRKERKQRKSRKCKKSFFGLF